MFGGGYFGDGYFGGGFYGADGGGGIAAPSVPAAVAQGFGDAWADRDRDPSDFLREVARLKRGEQGFSVEVHATELRVDVHATEVDVNVVERGNLIYLTATFSEEPSEVHCVYTRPGEERPIADPGFDQPGSRIVRVEEGVYTMTIDTTGFAGGTLSWHLWGLDENGEALGSAFDDIEIPKRKAQLL